MFTLTLMSPPAARMIDAASPAAFSSTTSPSATTRPVSSATRMNTSGGTSTPLDFQRARASTPVMRPVEARTTGW